MNLIKYLTITTILILSFTEAFSQMPPDDPTEVEIHGFVNYDTNFILHPLGLPVLEHFFTKLDTLIFLGEGRVSILHIGGSHIQTDVYSHQMRSRLQNLQPGMNGGRGFIFPAAMAGTNNPRNFIVSYTGNWESCRNTQRNRTCNLGIGGMMVATADSVATITFRPRSANEPFKTNLIRVYHYDTESVYQVSLVSHNHYLVNSVEYISNSVGYTEIRLNEPVDTFTIKIYRNHSEPSSFELYGIEILSDDPGIVYHSVGVNGASIPSFLRCNLLQEQVKAVKPDLVILSLGTNDAFSSNFDPDMYKRNYIRLIEVIKNASPQADILITVPNDVYFNRRRANTNTSLQEEVIYQLAVDYGYGVWNFFQVMGGLNSVPQWYNNGMMQKDRIHFTPKGYVLKGDLFFSAMMKSYGNHLEKLKVKN